MPSTDVQVPATGPRLRVAALPPLTLYVHLPWCVRKCPYCDFNSHEARGTLPEHEYVDALIADLESTLPSVWGRRVHSIFFGGGTPSLFSAHSLDRLLAAIRARLPLEPDAEITLEANPGTFESDKFRDFRMAGVNRLSIGIQSFNPKHLAALGRIHDEREAYRAVEIAHAHFENFNLDLMFALPEQTKEEADRDVEAALAARATDLAASRCCVRAVPDEQALADWTAERIANGEVVGWFQGRMEWGARALGNRSILADPRRADMRDIINSKIKFREKFRPFAPSVLEEEQARFFVGSVPDPFMVQVYPVRADKQGVIPAVTHVDGSGRLQTVSRTSNPRYWALIKAFEQRTGVPVVLNTSFNENEPIVLQPAEALDCFLRTQMDVLVLGHHVVTKGAAAGHPASEGERNGLA